MPQRELIGANAPPHATLPLTGGEVFHAVDEDGESVVIAVEDLPSGEPSDDVPEDLGVASAGVATTYSRGDHVHAMPTAEDVEALPVMSPAPAIGRVLVADGAGGLADGGVLLDEIGGAASPAPAVHTAATLTLTDDHRNSELRVSGASNAVSIRIPETLTGGEVGDATAFETSIIVTDATTNPVTIATGAGLLTPVLYPPGATITDDNTQVAIKVVRGVAYVAIVSPAATGFEGAPRVQAVHTSPTRLIAPGDANEIMQFSSVSNAVAITVSASLFESAGPGKSFVCSGKVVNITNPITFVAAGGLTLYYLGARSTLTTVRDRFVIEVVSATEAFIYIAAVL